MLIRGFERGVRLSCRIGGVYICTMTNLRQGGPKYATRLLTCVLIGWSTVALKAQTSNGYVFVAPGGVTCCGYTSMTLQFGVGGEVVLGKGIGVGAELGALGAR